MLDDPSQIYSKMCSLLVLSTFNGKERFERIRDVLINYVKFFDTEYGVGWTGRRVASLEFGLYRKGMPFIPDWDWCVNYWLGYESKSDRRLAISCPAVFQFEEPPRTEHELRILDLFACQTHVRAEKEEKEWRERDGSIRTYSTPQAGVKSAAGPKRTRRKLLAHGTC